MLVKINGKNLARWRKKRDYTQAYLAEKIGISQKTLAFYETGRIQSCKEETIEKLADVLNIAKNSLILEEKSEKKSTTFIPAYAGYVMKGMYRGEKTLSSDIQEVLTPENDFKMSERVSNLLLYMEGFSDPKEFYHCKLRIYYLIGDYFANSDLVIFIDKLALRESAWSKIIDLLKELDTYIPNDLVDAFRSYRVKSHEERRNLLIYTYYYVIEIYYDLYSSIFSLNQDVQITKKLCYQIHYVLEIICSLLKDVVRLSSEDTRAFCDNVMDELERGITGQSRISFTTALQWS